MMDDDPLENLIKNLISMLVEEWYEVGKTSRYTRGPSITGEMWDCRSLIVKGRDGRQIRITIEVPINLTP